MNRFEQLMTVGTLLLATSGFPGTQAQIDSEIEVLRSAMRTERQAVVAMNMNLTDQESEKFWKVYRDYQDELRTVRDRTTRLITDFAKNQATLGDKQSSDMLKEWTAIEKDEIGLKKEYINKFGKVIPPSKVARYFQIENKMDAVIRLDLAQEIPLVTKK